MKHAILLALLACELLAQTQLTMSAPGANPVTGIAAFTVGQNAGQNIYYWVVARTPSGYTSPVNVVAFNTVGISNLTSSNYVTIVWNAVPLATGYDVIRSATATYPASTSCASCAVALNQAGVTFNDQGGGTSAYPPGGSLGVVSSDANYTVDNLTEQYPFVNLQVSNPRYSYITRITGGRNQLTACTITTGTTTAYICNGSAQSPTRPPISTLTGAGWLGLVLQFIPNATNTGASTVNLDGLGAVTIQKLSSGSLAAVASGDLVAGVPFLLRYNGTVFVMDPGTGSGGGGGGVTDCGANGVMVRTALNTTVCRTITAGAGIAITNGDGVSGNPTVTASGSSSSPFFVPSRGNGTTTNSQITLSCASAPFCAIDVYGVSAYTRTLNITADISSNTGPASGTMYIYYTPSSQTVFCDENTTAVLTVSGCTAASTGGVPAGSIPLGTSTGGYAFNTSSAFTDPTTLPLNTQYQPPVLCGTGLSCSQNATTGLVTASASVPVGYSALTDGATITWAINSGYLSSASVTLAGNRTLNITNPVDGGQYVLVVTQDATGSRGLTLGTGCTWKVSGGGAGAITPTTTANAVDVLTFSYRATGTVCYANFNKNFN